MYNVHQERRKEEPDYCAKSATCLCAWTVFLHITPKCVRLNIFDRNKFAVCQICVFELVFIFMNLILLGLIDLTIKYCRDKIVSLPV